MTRASTLDVWERSSLDRPEAHDGGPSNASPGRARRWGDARGVAFGVMDVPEDLRYSPDHEWVRIEGSRARIGITEYAQDALGDIVFVQVPDVGSAVSAGGGVSEVESTKSVSEVYAPVSGTVIEVNEDLAETPERINDDPYGEGWICVIEADELSQLDGLLDAEGYRKLIEG